MSAHALMDTEFEVSDVTGQKILAVNQVPADATVGDLVRGLVARMRLPPNDTAGRPLTYHARSDREGRHLGGSERVTDAVQRGDRVVLQPNVDAGEGVVRVRQRLVMELLGMDGEVAGHAPLDPDWVPAIEWTRLAGLRGRGVWAPSAAAERGVDVLWHSDLAAPYTRGFRVLLDDQAGTAWHEDFPVTYFADHARAVAAALVAKGALAEGDTYRYRVLAYDGEGDGSLEAEVPFNATERAAPLDLHEVPVTAGRGSPCSAGDADVADFEVYVPSAALEEASALTAEAGDVETGGVLIGQLGREAPVVRSGADGDVAAPGPDICVAITALIPARHTRGDSTKLTFTSETWTDVRSAVALRGRGEIVLGWFHSHPQHAWCRERGCTPEAQRQCASAAGFLSADDIALHRTMFPRAFTVALVMTHSIRGIVPRLFGWRAGRLEPRGYRRLAEPFVLGDRPHATLATT